jgi:hypothetical protein
MIVANHWAIYLSLRKAAAWRRLRIHYPKSNRIAPFRQGDDFSHSRGCKPPFAEATVSGEVASIAAIRVPAMPTKATIHSRKLARRVIR